MTKKNFSWGSSVDCKQSFVQQFDRIVFIPGKKCLLCLKEIILFTYRNTLMTSSAESQKGQKMVLALPLCAEGQLLSYCLNVLSFIRHTPKRILLQDHRY